ncbi:MAG: peptidoglycan DD-metalloendopeptidase family protein [Bacteroidota bacterium]|nr:peptidoglycan DD-metalloendopeptidase family protein [Bacteroidota bacterium]
MNKVGKFFLLILLVVLSVTSYGQSLDDLRKKKEKTNEEIKYTNRLLEEAKKNEKQTLNKYKILNKQIELRTSLITGINSEVGVLADFIDQNAWLVSSLNADLEELKREYAGMIQFAQRNQTNYSKVLFLLSADSFNQAYKRLMYLRQYAEYRKKQAELIQWLRDLVQVKVKNLERQRTEKETLLQSKKREADQLNKEKKQQGQNLTKLQQQQKDFQKKLREQQRIDAQLSREIQKIIEEEIKRAQKKAKDDGKTGTAYEMTPEQKLVSGQFEQNKRRIPWPVERGVITDRFGVHEHPVLKNIQVRNNGIDISTAQGSTARSVFAGEVSRVFMVSGGNTAVIIRHGIYLTVYSNLVNVQVKSGDKVSVKQTIGTVATDNEDGDKTVLKFQIWKENVKLNPEEWIAR